MPETTILIVEDNILISLALQRKLTRQGYTVLPPVDTGEKAVIIALEQRPAIILMDIGLAGAMDGFAAAEQIRLSAPVPIIFVTGNTQDARLQSAIYLPKPVADQTLFRCIENTLHS